MKNVFLLFIVVIISLALFTTCFSDSRPRSADITLDKASDFGETDNITKLFYDVCSNKMSPSEATVFVLSQKSLVEKYGAPSRIFEYVYRGDPDGKVIDIYYGGYFVTEEKYENYNGKFSFYVLNDGNGYLQDWKINDDFYQYSELLNTDDLKKENITKIFGVDYKEFSDYFPDRSKISYRMENSTLSFMFKNDILTKITWSGDR
jgi:hypothetical protein